MLIAEHAEEAEEAEEAEDTEDTDLKRRNGGTETNGASR